MRTFVALLVAANLVMFVWAGWLREPVEPVRAPEAGGLPPFEQGPEGLVLLSELPVDGSAAPVRPFEIPEIPTELSETETGPSETVGQLAETATTPAPFPVETATTAAESPDETAIASTQSPVETSITTAQSPAETAITRAQSPTTPAAPTQPPEAATTPVPPPEGPAWCADIGLFTAADQAQALLPELLLLGVDARLAQGRRPVGITHWVHSRLFANESEARELLSELQSRNIDSFYMRDGELAGRISLGVFSRAESAARLQETLRTQGYMAEVSQVRRQEERFWLELEAPSRGVLEAEGWRTLASRVGLAQGDLDTLPAGSLGVSEKVCEPVATANQFP